MFRSAFIALLALVYAPAAFPASCDSINSPIQWNVRTQYVDTTYNRIQSDGKGVYINGQSGVDAVLNACSGSGDARIQISGKTRWVNFSFERMLTTNQYTPSFALSSTPVKVMSMNVRNLLYVPPGTDRTHEFTFTTRLGSGINAAMLANPVDAPQVEVGSNVAIANSPLANSPIVVLHCPAGPNTPTCQKSTLHETWFAYPSPTPTASGTSNGWPVTQVGALMVQGGSGKNAQTVNGGEFSMTFYFEISLLN
jgi:hypothetical protein